MSNQTRVTLKALIAFILRDISEAILHQIPGYDQEGENV